MSSGKEETIVDNEVYNVLRAAADKLEGLAAYDKYMQDGTANTQTWQQLKQQDQQAVRQLLQQLNQFAQQGKLTAK
jgi:oligoendopeptidase F